MKRNPSMPYEEAAQVWRFVENVAASPIASWYQIAGVHGGGSPIMETITLNMEIDYEEKKNVAKYLAGINKELDQSKALNNNPSPLTFQKDRGL